MATKQAYVQVKGLKKHYGDGDARLTVLDGIDTSINRGEICVMLGPSGSGKTTTAMKIEEELEYPGQIKVNMIRETKVIEYAK